MTMNTTDCLASEHSLHRILRTTYISMDFLLTLFGNILTIIVTRRVEEFSESSKIFITSLAVADLGVAVVVAISLVTEISGHWMLPEWMCVTSFLLFYIFTAVSIFMVLVMTFDRQIAVVRPLRYSLILTKRRCLTAVAIVWLASITGAIITTSTNFIKYNECSALCTTTVRVIGQSVVSVLLFYFIPIALILPMNVKLLLVAHQQAKRSRNRVGVFQVQHSTLASNIPDPLPNTGRGIRGKAVGIVTLITFAFIFSWSFFYVKLLHSTLSNGQEVFPEWVEFTAIWLALSNSWLNVIIYSIMNRSFREHLMGLLMRVFPWCPTR